MVRARHPLQLLVAHHAVQEVGARLEAEDRVGELDRARVAASSVVTSAFIASSFLAWPCRYLNAPGLGASFGSGRLTASRTSTQPPFEPGTAAP